MAENEDILFTTKEIKAIQTYYGQVLRKLKANLYTEKEARKYLIKYRSTNTSCCEGLSFLVNKAKKQGFGFYTCVKNALFGLKRGRVAVLVAKLSPLSKDYPIEECLLPHTDTFMLLYQSTRCDINIRDYAIIEYFVPIFTLFICRGSNLEDILLPHSNNKELNIDQQHEKNLEACRYLLCTRGKGYCPWDSSMMLVMTLYLRDYLEIVEEKKYIKIL
jgi:hypothetical protein